VESTGVIEECLGGKLVDFFFSEKPSCFHLRLVEPGARNKIVVNSFGQVAMITYSGGGKV
jgi:hypothetical protein